MAKRRDKTGLDEREEAFARAYVRCRNARVAYEAYKPDTQADPESKRVAGYRLLSLAHIALRIEQLRAIAIEKSNATVSSLMQELDEARELAMEIEQPGNARAATMDKARIAGFLKPEDKLNLGGVSVVVHISPEDAALG